MKHNRKKFFISFLLFFSITSIQCYSPQGNNVLNEQRKVFGIETNTNNLLDHFPERIKKGSFYLHAYPPSCPPTYECSAQFGTISLIVNKQSYHKELSMIFERKIVYKTSYSDSNIIINLLELRKINSPVEKCNKWYSNKLPVPYFENYNFGLGKKEISKTVDGELYFNSTYIIPSDLLVYVINAEAGDFWKESCNEKRPESLKEWKHGYSKGFALSEEKNIIVYWTMIW